VTPPIALVESVQLALVGLGVLVANGVILIINGYIARRVEERKEATAKERREQEAKDAKTAKEAADLKAAAIAREVKDAAEKAATAAVKVEEVKQRLETTTATNAGMLAQIAKVGEATHTLVNSNMGTQLKISAVALRRVAELTKHPDDLAAADLADKGLHEHEGKQAIVDSGARTPVATQAKGGT
jgi:ABC-type transport system involved in cytochrome bd biosynthesis fused ATPase/permease subunit